MNHKLFRKNWKEISKNERQTLLYKLGEQYKMELKEYVHFSCYGQETDTAVYTYKDSEFVFVPGDIVTLGYDYKKAELDPQSRGILYMELDETLILEREIFGEDSDYWDYYENEKEYEELLINYAESLDKFGAKKMLQTYLKKILTKIRQAEIMPMLVEREITFPLWKPISLNDLFITQNKKLLEQIESFKKSNLRSYIGKIKLVREKEEIKAYQYLYRNKEQLIEQILSTGFSLPTEDEWEYLCGGGCRTLFPWGEGFYKEMLQTKEIKLETPNFFGLFIAYDTYKNEIMLDGGFKGGDGGCFACGGYTGMTCIIASPYYTNRVFEEREENELFRDFDCIRRIIRIT